MRSTLAKGASGCVRARAGPAAGRGLAAQVERRRQDVIEPLVDGDAKAGNHDHHARGQGEADDQPTGRHLRHQRRLRDILQRDALRRRQGLGAEPAEKQLREQRRAGDADDQHQGNRRIAGERQFEQRWQLRQRERGQCQQRGSNAVRRRQPRPPDCPGCPWLRGAAASGVAVVRSRFSAPAPAAACGSGTPGRAAPARLARQPSARKSSAGAGAGTISGALPAK
jgi:hypothetical protein